MQFYGHANKEPMVCWADEVCCFKPINYCMCCGHWMCNGHTDVHLWTYYSPTARTATEGIICTACIETMRSSRNAKIIGLRDADELPSQRDREMEIKALYAIKEGNVSLELAMWLQDYMEGLVRDE